MVRTLKNWQPPFTLVEVGCALAIALVLGGISIDSAV